MNLLRRFLSLPRLKSQRSQTQSPQLRNPVFMRRKRLSNQAQFSKMQLLKWYVLSLRSRSRNLGRRDYTSHILEY
jgi:hypothetical protein